MILTLNQYAALRFAILEDSKRDARAKQMLAPMLALLEPPFENEEFVFERRPRGDTIPPEVPPGAAPWVFGSWVILDQDRPAQRRGEPYWTLMPFDGVSGGSFCRGPFGRKSIEDETVIYATGCETEGIDFDEDFLKLMLEKLNGRGS